MVRRPECNEAVEEVTNRKESLVVLDLYFCVFLVAEFKRLVDYF